MRRSIVLGFSAIAVVVAACGRSAPVELRAELAPTEVSGGVPVDLTLTVTAEAPVTEDSLVLLGFPHYWYSQRGTGLPMPIPETAWTGSMHWFASAPLERGDRSVELTLSGWVPPTVRGPLQPVVFILPGGKERKARRLQVGALTVDAPPGTPSPQPASAAPMLLEMGQTRSLVYADLHGHSARSDGNRSPDAWYGHARDVGRLHAASLSDHDWQLDAAEWKELVDVAARYDRPGAFVAIPSMELGIWGHEVAYFFDPTCLDGHDVHAEGGVRTIHEESDFGHDSAWLHPEPKVLFEACRDSLVVASHSTLHDAGMGTRFPLRAPPPGYVAIEVYSAHGNSECLACPRAIRPAEGGGDSGSVRDALDAHGPLAFLAAGDSHDGMPGTTSWGPHPGGLTGLWVDELSRAGILDAIRARRTFGTTGVRPVIQWEEAPGGIRYRIVAAEPVLAVVAVQDGVEARLGPPPPGEWTTWIAPTPTRRWLYLRVELEGGHIAWTSPLGATTL